MRMSPTALKRPATPCSPSPDCRHRNGEAPGPRTPSNASTRSSSGGSRPRLCCRPPTQRQCCSGLCSLPARSSCERWMAGRRSRRSSSTVRLTWPPEPIPSTHRRAASHEFQHDLRRHLLRAGRCTFWSGNDRASLGWTPAVNCRIEAAATTDIARRGDRQ